ncbi:mechanosensitive ion channel family protein [Gymnodinialimonas ceratoperidinii]|uniref:Small-conductance mechanosensitive channel n=1 Tax=Gymnodinialimonas ceratoperidinii TaxID=2856823 RepID=A0A8F6TXL7_9RHOB|nr:mechanosensitive ion channel family protein [Gymnodinialimonas ceratoperidinii]QXT40535.1 mechanosensitive ion channel [Gymnodinialimonas ceratoperidinii]
MRRLLHPILATLLAIALGGPVVAQTDGGQPDGTIAVESDRAQDFAVRDRIMAILGQLEGYDDVRATVSSGIVTLRGTVVDATRITALNDLVARVEGVVAIENTVSESTDVVERLNPAVERMQERIAQTIAFSPLILVALSAGGLIIIFGFWLARLKWPWDRIAPNAFIADIYRQIVRLAFVVIGIVLALDLLNATALLGTILGAAGIVGLAIGFAVRDTVENFISSIMLSIRQPFRPKDLVEIEGDLGHVIRLTSRATILLSPDGNHIRIPNSTVFKAKIINYTRNDERRFTFLVGIDPNADISEAQRIILAALGELPFLLDAPGPAVWVEGLGASTIDITAAGWIRQHETGIGMAKGEAIRVVKARLEEAGIALPEPTYRLIGAEASELDTSAPAKPTAAPAQVEVQNVGTDEDAALKEIIEAEREALPDDDLLRREAPQE